MKKYLFVTFLTVVMFFPLQIVFAQAVSSSAKENIVGSIQEGGHINAFRADRIIGSGVINLEAERIGTIKNLVIDTDTGSILYAVLEFGGFMGFGDKLFAVPWHSLAAVPAEGIFILDQSREKLEKAPGFDKNNWPDVGDQSWGAGIYEFYDHHIPTPRISATPTAAQKQERHRGYRSYPGYATEFHPYRPYRTIWQNLYEGIFDPKKIETVIGEIVKIEYDEEVRLILYTAAKKPVLVALGPTGYFGGQQKVLKQGNKVTVTGSRIIVDDTPFMIATNVKEGNEELQLRDNQGHPTWMGWKKIK